MLAILPLYRASNRMALHQLGMDRVWFQTYSPFGEGDRMKLLETRFRLFSTALRGLWDGVAQSFPQH
jgi:hypothetical protein